MASEQKILSATNIQALNRKIEEAQKEGWECIGGHTATPWHSQLKYAGRQHMETEHQATFAQSVRRNINL